MNNIETDLRNIQTQLSPNHTLYFMHNNSICFAQEIEDAELFNWFKMESTLIDLNIYIEDNILNFYVSNLIDTFNFLWSLDDKEIIQLLLRSDNLKFYVVNHIDSNNELIYYLKELELTQYHKETIISYLLDTYDKTYTNLRDKFGRNYPFENCEELLRSVVPDILNERIIGEKAVDVKQTILDNFDIDINDVTNLNKLEAIIDFVKTKFDITPLKIGVCIKSKNDNSQCKLCNKCKR